LFRRDKKAELTYIPTGRARLTWPKLTSVQVPVQLTAVVVCL